ncbi:hypothetical protein FTO74_05145 [Granulicella sp. WH15]|nr:hypothetical protein FTO74_05145 [Granulicella sp. WH15]
MPFGPDGGDARAFAADPHDHQHLYLGTTNGWMYESHTGGQSWQRLARVGKRDDLVLDNILVDAANPRHLLVGAWVLDHPDGGLFVSNDGGVTWSVQSEMRGQSIRALTASLSDPKTIVAGTLRGVYRSKDSGQHWTLISPEDSKELHNIESIAIDPKDPQTIYAGTWHLPWKTTDGGANWSNIKQGIIEDSDVFSIIVDPAKPRTVYASACSGIYKSENGGEQFLKVQGIPSSARRTRVLLQDPNHLDTVFAGTTEGLFRSGDAGKSWARTTVSDVIVNDVYIDPANSQKVLLATDRGGVVASFDGGYTFQSSNQGFSARQISAYTQTRNHSVYIGVVNDKEWGGVFQSDNGGLNWMQVSVGLEGKDVFSLGTAPDGTLLAGTSHGIFHLADGLWQRAGDVRAAAPVAVKKAGSRSIKGRAVPTAKATLKTPAKHFDGAVFALATTPNTVLAATAEGILSSPDSGNSWHPVSALSADEWRFLASTRNAVVAATLHSVSHSTDGGQTWTGITPPPALSQIGAVSVDGAGSIWVGGREGIFISDNGGQSWTTPSNLFLSGVNSLFFDEPANRMLITANGTSTVAFTVQLPQRSVKFIETGWNLRFVRPVDDHFIAATLFDGIVVQPRMVASPITASR